VSRIIGCFRGKVRNMNYSPKYEPNYGVKVFLQNHSKNFNDYICNKKIKVFPGSWKFASQNLIDMATDHEYKYSTEQLIDGYFSRIGVDLFLPRLYPPKPEHIFSLKTKPKSFPGILTSLTCGSKRRTSIPFTKGVAMEYANTIMNSEKQILDTSLLYVGGREKRVVVEHSEDSL